MGSPGGVPVASCAIDASGWDASGWEVSGLATPPAPSSASSGLVGSSIGPMASTNCVSTSEKVKAA